MYRPAQGVRMLVGGLAAAALLAAGCSSSSKSSSTTGSASGKATATTAAKPTGEPIKIGYLNNEGGATFSVPELRIGAQVAADYVNNTLGGVNGRPIQLVPCADDGSPEKSIDCANKLIEAKVVAVLEGTDLGADAVLPILKPANIPLVGHVQFGNAQMVDDNSYFFGSAALAYGGAALKYYADQGIKSVEWFMPDQAAMHAFTDAVLTPTAAKLGLKYKSIYYDPTAPNFSVLATTAVTDKAQASGSIVGTDGACASFIGALRDAGYQGRILAASCSGLFGSIGDKAVGVDTDSDHWNPSDVESAPIAKQQELQLYTQQMTAAKHSDLVRGNAVIGFADVMNLSRILTTVQSPVDGTAVTKAIRGTRDFDSFLGPKITCDHSLIPGNSACAAGLLFFRVQKDGSVKAQTPDFVVAG